ncbi:MAG TPA: hypothetical protein VE173_12540, partial [Longimicrobiales bacterium]|nr:hypothetical protein [Longimicrobiales bacterium]
NVKAVREIPTALGTRFMVEVALEEGGSRHRRVPTTPMIKKVAAMLILALTPLRRLLVVGALLAGTLAASNLSAQSTLTGGAVFSGELGEGQRSFLLAGGWLTRSGAGWSPLASVIAYHLRYPVVGQDPRSMEAINPAAGLRRGWSAGGIQGTVGYAWQWNDDEEVRAVPGLQRVSEGVTTALQGNYWGDGRQAAQAILSYSWGGDGYLWSQARGTHRVAGVGGGDLRLGVEGSVEGSQGIDAWAVGPVLDLGLSGQALLFATGVRRLDPDVGESTNLWYMRLDVVLLR